MREGTSPNVCGSRDVCTLITVSAGPAVRWDAVTTMTRPFPGFSVHLLREKRLLRVWELGWDDTSTPPPAGKVLYNINRFRARSLDTYKFIMFTATTGCVAVRVWHERLSLSALKIILLSFTRGGQTYADRPIEADYSKPFRELLLPEEDSAKNSSRFTCHIKKNYSFSTHTLRQGAG